MQSVRLRGMPLLVKKNFVKHSERDMERFKEFMEKPISVENSRGYLTHCQGGKEADVSSTKDLASICHEGLK